MKTKTGSIKYIDGVPFARISFFDELGVRKFRLKKAKNDTHARTLCKEMLRELEENGQAGVDGSKMSFSQLADYYKKNYLTEPEYQNDRKVSGLRTAKDRGYTLNTLRSYFGTKLIRSITPGVIKGFKETRLSTPKKNGGALSITAVNRDLALLRAMLRIACGEGWIAKVPRIQLDVSAEVVRRRTLSLEEEGILLEECDPLIRTLVVFALGTGMRQGEILSLSAEDIDLKHQQINIRALNTKTLTSRAVPISKRVEAELEGLPKSGKLFESEWFPKKDWRAALSSAGIEDFHFHDLRMTFGQRLIDRGLGISEVGKLLGHANVSTTYRHYQTSSDVTTQKAKALLDGH